MNVATAALAAGLPFTLGSPASFDGLTVIPLFARAGRLEYIGFAEAVAAGLGVRVTPGGGTRVVVENPLPHRVLVYAGEELVAARRLRARRTALIEADSVATLPAAAAPTAEAAGANVAAYRDALPRRDGQSGALVAVGGVVAALDFVGRSDVFAGLYAGLLHRYVLRAAGSRDARPLSPGAAARFLASIDGRRLRLARAVAAGSETRYDGAVFGVELSAHGEVVAMTVYPRAE